MHLPETAAVDRLELQDFCWLEVQSENTEHDIEQTFVRHKNIIGNYDSHLNFKRYFSRSILPTLIQNYLLVMGQKQVILAVVANNFT